MTTSLLSGADHLFVRGMLRELPPLEGDYREAHGTWTEDGLRVWVEALEKGLRVVYDVRTAVVEEVA